MLRERLLSILAESLGGDCLAAEYVLLTLISRVYKRARDVDDLTLGCFSVNLTGCDAKGTDENFCDMTQCLDHALSLLVSRQKKLSISCKSSPPNVNFTMCF